MLSELDKWELKEAIVGLKITHRASGFYEYLAVDPFAPRNVCMEKMRIEEAKVRILDRIEDKLHSLVVSHFSGTEFKFQFRADIDALEISKKANSGSEYTQLVSVKEIFNARYPGQTIRNYIKEINTRVSADNKGTRADEATSESIDLLGANILSESQEERLNYLIEECSEVIQAATKILRHGYESHHPDGGPNNKSNLEKELGDLNVARSLLADNGDVDMASVCTHGSAKMKKFEAGNHYFHYQKIG